MVRKTSSRYHVSPQRGRGRRHSLAEDCPHVRHHCRTVSEVTTIPRWARSSSPVPKTEREAKREPHSVADHLRRETEPFVIGRDRKSTRLNSSHSQISYA